MTQLSDFTQNVVPLEIDRRLIDKFVTLLGYNAQLVTEVISREIRIMTERLPPTEKQRGKDKLSRIPVKVEAKAPLRKPSWIRVRLPNDNSVAKLKQYVSRT